MSQFQLSVAAPDRTIFEGEVQSVVVPAHEGSLGVLSNHEPMITALKTGLLEYVDLDDQRHFIAVTGGFLEVSSNQAIILADSAEIASEIDLAQAEHDLEEARKTLRGEETGMSRAEARHELNRAIPLFIGGRGRGWGSIRGLESSQRTPHPCPSPLQARGRDSTQTLWCGRPRLHSPRLPSTP
jgi:F-type H+-transporting ATPase subunit epsilon